jgi:4-amino-4-deoxy-L-arabinose transferase-like glycosyltransferase
MLNGIILFVAIGLIALFKAPEAYRIPVFFLLIFSAAACALYFWYQYRSTREWLHKQE